MTRLNRRRFILAGVGAAGALGIGWLAAPVRQRLVAATPPQGPAGSHRLNGWVTIGADDSVTISMSKMEMGQGIYTGLAMLLAEELEADWARVEVVPAFSDAIYNNQALITVAANGLDPRHEGRMLRPAAEHVLRKVARELPGFAITGASSSMRDQWEPMREAGASARMMLIQAASNLWGVPASQCSAVRGRVVHASGRSASFGTLAQAASQLPLPGSVRLKAPAEFKIIGKPLPRVDGLAKSTGTAVYSIDALPDGLQYASIRMCPALGGKVGQFDAARAKAVPGVTAVIALEPQAGGVGSLGSTSGGVAVVARSPHAAMRGAEALEVAWEPGSGSAASSAEVLAGLRQAVQAADAKVLYERGDVDAAMQAGGAVVSGLYEVPFLAHAAMEPMNCTVRFDKGAADVWVGCQAPGMLRAAVARALGIGASQVRVHAQLMGGGFGRKSFTDCAVQAALVARELQGLPVQVFWTREQDMRHDFYRPAFVGRCRAVLDSSGRVTAWGLDLAGSSLGQPALMDPSREGAANTAYEFPNTRVRHAIVEPGLPTGIWRSVAHSYNAFFVESFVDELAAAAKADPVAFRRTLLAGKPRHLHVLDTAARLSAWGQDLPPTGDGQRQALGIALHESFGSVVAQVARVSVDAARNIRIHEVLCVIDCGLPVNPGLIQQQMEGGIVYGLSAALYGQVDIDKGQVRQSNFHDYAPLRMRDCPSMTSHIVPSTNAPSGVGEASTPPIAPAVANALFALTGQRLRSLPLKLA